MVGCAAGLLLGVQSSNKVVKGVKDNLQLCVSQEVTQGREWVCDGSCCRWRRGLRDLVERFDECEKNMIALPCVHGGIEPIKEHKIFFEEFRVVHGCPSLGGVRFG